MSAPITTPEAMASEPMSTRAPADDRAESDRLDEDDQRRELWERAIGWGIVAICMVAVFYIMDPGLRLWPLWHPSKLSTGALFTDTTANGGDMGAHVWWPHFLIHNWFSWNPFKFRLAGWAPDWYAGFPVGQYYFPVPALMVAALDVVMPYNVAFKLVTVSGPLLLPAAAYSFARGMRAPWPAPPAFAVAAFATLVQTRNDWQIYGGNIASTLAGEFSFCIGLALALFALGALAYSLDTGKRLWLPALLIALAIMSHIVVAIFIALAAGLLWLTRRPLRTWRLAFPVGGVGVAITAVWLFPLFANQTYTQSMRYTKLYPKGTYTLLPSWLMPIAPVRNAINGFARALTRPPLDPNTTPRRHFSPTLWMPWWVWALVLVAFLAACWYRRRSTGVLLVLAAVIGILFIQWPEHAIWNTRFLPFWILSLAFVAAMGATEIARWGGMAVRWAYRWIREGDLQDARARAWAELATADPDNTDEEMRRDAAWALAERRFDRAPEGWEPPGGLEPERIKRHARIAGSIGLAVVMLIGSAFALHRAWDGKDDNPGISIRGWAAWNYTGYEKKAAYPQFKAVMDGMNEVADKYGPGRALWEPSSGDPDALNSYGTSLALELLPLFTNGRIGSMEGIYFESSATTSYHFLMVSECAAHPSNPVRGLVYGTPSTDFDLCVKHMQDLGVRYYMPWTKQMQDLADKSKDLKLIKTIPQNPPISAPAPEKELKEWKVYEVAGSDLVVPMKTEPVVATNIDNGDYKYSKCWNTEYNDTTTPEPKLNPWECIAAPWWMNRDAQKTDFVPDSTAGLLASVKNAFTGVAPKAPPKDWQRVDAREIASVTPRPVDNPPTVSNIKRDVNSIEFDVSDVGRPIEVRESFYPNWKVSGAKGPYRLSPNTMVVIPTKTHVKLSYGLTKADWLGRFVTLLGIAGLVLLALWKGARRYGAGVRRTDDDQGNGNGDVAEPETGDAPAGAADGSAPPTDGEWGTAPPDAGTDEPDEPAPPDETPGAPPSDPSEPAPALP